MTGAILAALLLGCGGRLIAGSDAVGEPVPEGEWGGEHIRLVVGGAGASVEFDCATGRINGPLRTNAEGRFEAAGTWTPERGGPARPGQRRPADRSALYRGWTDGDTMRVEVTIPDLNLELGPFLLHPGRTPLLDKCV